MATQIYDFKNIVLIDGTEIYATPLKIKYLREFLEIFEGMKDAKDDDEAVDVLLRCVRVAMKQYCPIIKTVEDVADNFDMPAIYSIMDVAAGIKISKDKEDEEPIQKQATDSGSTWESLDLAKLEAEAFLLGIWKDYEDLESSLSMPELTKTLEIKRELDYSDKKFHASIQGIDLDKQVGKKEDNAWERMKAKVFSGGQATDSSDILAYQGVNAQKAGFGIGMGISYEKID